MTNHERLFDATQAFDHPFVVGAIGAVTVALLAASTAIRVLSRNGKISDETYRELLARVRSWYVLCAAMILPILLGAVWVCAFFYVLALFCFREFARATKLSESRSAIVSVVVAMTLVYFAVLDHWMGLFTTSWAWGCCFIAIVGLLPDQPLGYLRRISLAIIGFALFGVSLGHLAFLSNDRLFRPILLWLLICTELNDVFAYIAGKIFGRRKLLPNTSPNKTRGGAIGAVFATTALAVGIGFFVFRGTTLGTWPHLIVMGIMISVFGQCGDLLISSIKRDLGVKDMSAIIPGHGGLLDRFDSLLLVAPILFHYMNYFLASGIGGDLPSRILTGDWF